MTTYSEDFKKMVASEVIDNNRKQADLSREYGLRSQMVSRWVSEYRSGISWSRGAEEKERDKELYKLKKENRRLNMENEILKKASAFFARNQK